MGLVLCIGLIAIFSQAGFCQEESTKAEKVNINTASQEKLCQLKGVGESIAQRIIDYRAENGPFENPEDITKVKGIGEKIWQANEDTIVVQ